MPGGYREQTNQILQQWQKTGLKQTSENIVKGLVSLERLHQLEKWSVQTHNPQIWNGILGEEYGEFAKAMNEYTFSKDPQAKQHYKVEMIKEMVQVIAVAQACAENLLDDQWSYQEMLDYEA